MRPRIKDATKVTLSLEKRVKDLGRELAEARGLSFTALVETLIMEDSRKRGGGSVQTVGLPITASVPGERNEGSRSKTPKQARVPTSSIPSSYLESASVVTAKKDPFYPVKDPQLAFRRGDSLVVVEGVRPRPGDVALVRVGKLTTLAEMSEAGVYRPVFKHDNLDGTTEYVGVVWSVIQSS